MSLDRLVKATDTDHVVEVESAILRVYFTPLFAKPGDEVTIIIETNNVSDNSDAHVRIYTEDDRETAFEELDGQISSNRLELQYTPLEGATDDETLRERLGINFFKMLRCQVTIESLSLDFERSDNALGFGKIGCIIQSLEECFAPYAEEQEIRYKFIDPDGEIQGAKLKVYATNYEDSNYPDDGALVYEADIIADQRRHFQDKVIRWLGNTTAEAGPLTQGGTDIVYINPQYSPYTVEIKFSINNENPDDDGDARSSYQHPNSAGEAVDWTFKVQYHSVHMEMGEYVPRNLLPDRSSERDKWVQYRLNSLGYPCGPVDGTVGTETTKAIKNFQRAHWKVPWPEGENADKEPLVVNGTVDADTFAVLESSQLERRQLFSDPDDLFDSDARVRLYTWSNMFYSYQAPTEDGEQEWNTTHRDEWWDSRFTPRMFPRHEAEARRLVRPWVPIKGKIMLRNKAGEGAFVPQSVGEVRVNFKVVDPNEDLSVTNSAEDHVAREYIDRARAQVDSALGDNCPEDHAGVRVTSESDLYKKYLHVGTKLEPYEAQDDSSNQVVYVNTPTEGEARGTAGIYFIPSYKAGDNYRIEAELSFEEHPNRENIEVNGEPFRTSSAQITNWRKMKVAAFLKFCTRAAVSEGDPSLRDRIANGLEAYERCYVEYAEPEFFGEVTEFLTEDEYKTVVHAQYPSRAEADIRWHPTTSIYGFDIREQNNGEDPNAYARFVKGLADDFCDKVLEPLGKQIINNVRKRVREGSVVIDYQPHDGVSIWRNKGAADETLITNNYRAGTYAVGLHNGLVYLDIMLQEKSNMDFAYLLAHEIGHTCFLYHWENTMTTTMSDAAHYERPVNFRTCPTHHDHDDNDCIMSYPIDFYMFPAPPAGLVLGTTPINSKRDYINYIETTGETHQRHHQLAVNCRPHFCGKCLLKLRGWNVENLPQSY